MPINDPTLKNFKPGAGPVVDPMAIPDIPLGNPVGAKPGEGAGGKPAGSGGGTGGTGTGQPAGSGEGHKTK